MRTGSATMPLHGGHCPPWLFARMKVLAATVAEVVVDTAGTGELLRRLSDPVWVQAFGSLLGFDWHSSGLSTVTMGALKEGLHERGADLGVYLCGGKGRSSRRCGAWRPSARPAPEPHSDAQTLPKAADRFIMFDERTFSDGGGRN